MGNLILHIMVFGGTVGSVAWVYIPEIVASKHISFVVSFTWLSASVAALLYPVIRDHVFDGNPTWIFIF